MIINIVLLLIALFVIYCSCKNGFEGLSCNQRSDYRIDVPYPAGMRIGQRGPFNVMTGAIDRSLF